MHFLCRTRRPPLCPEAEFARLLVREYLPGYPPEGAIFLVEVAASYGHVPAAVALNALRNRLDPTLPDLDPLPDDDGVIA